MIVQLSPISPARLTDLERLDRLHAECPGDLAAMQLASWCSVADDGEHLWLDAAECRSIGSAAQGDAWGDEFDAIIAYASSKGWTDASGTHVRAHIESVDPSAATSESTESAGA